MATSWSFTWIQHAADAWQQADLLSEYNTLLMHGNKLIFYLDTTHCWCMATSWSLTWIQHAAGAWQQADLLPRYNTLLMHGNKLIFFCLIFCFQVLYSSLKCLKIYKSLELFTFCKNRIDLKILDFLSYTYTHSILLQNFKDFDYSNVDNHPKLTKLAKWKMAKKMVYYIFFFFMNLK